MTADAPPDPPTAAPPGIRGRLARLAGSGRLLTVGGWGLFAASTVLAASLAAPAETVDEVVAPVRTAAAPARRWPSPPEGFVPPAAPEPPADDPDALFLGEPPAFAETDDGADGNDGSWEGLMSDLPPSAAEDLTALREQFGSVVPFAAEPPPVAPPPAGVRAEPVAERKPVQSSLDAAADACRANLAGAFTPGYRRLDAGGRVVLIPGPLRETGRPLDLALTGPGWFALDDAADPHAVRLTRAGAFAVHAGSLVFAADPGRSVRAAGGGRLNVPDDATAVRLDGAGTLLVTRTVTGEPVETAAGRVAVVAPADLAAVSPDGAFLYAPAGPVHELSGAPLRAGCLEGANVDLSAELARLAEIETARAALADGRPRIAARR